MFNRSSLLLCRFALIVLLAFSFAACSSCKKAPYKAPVGVQPLPGGDIDPITGQPRVSAGNLNEVRPLGGANGEVSADLKTIFFEYDSYALSGDAVRILESNAQWIKGHANVQIQIEGHCDNRGSVEYNVNLGQKRASAVREQLARCGVEPSRMTTISYGSARPMESGDNEAAWRKNRRAQFLVF
ncbi:TPA: peptidoglycan-associated lipoprotein Pal [Candidatus Sumerlaeota bacterium]|jgi:peptidoglycan-associated lipoprotein|nr:peptidoglycan-associated lipoprotein Pal [Candidatus Sumerlaeota bacterium]